jgi:hypothetical protein
MQNNFWGSQTFIFFTHEINGPDKNQAAIAP